MVSVQKTMLGGERMSVTEIEQRRAFLEAQLRVARLTADDATMRGNLEKAAQFRYGVIPNIERELNRLHRPDVQRPNEIKAVESYLDVIWPKWRQDPEMADTPRRVLDGWRELLSGGGDYDDWTVFDTKYTGILARVGVPVTAVCAHHLLAYRGVIHFAYIPDGKKLGISKIIRFLQHRCRVPSSQEELTDALVDEFAEVVKPRGVMLTFIAEHSCESDRGVRVSGVKTETSVVRGVFKDDPAAREEAKWLFSIGGKDDE
jgi:GTP cyclohydrolase IA